MTVYECQCGDAYFATNTEPKWCPWCGEALIQEADFTYKTKRV